MVKVPMCRCCGHPLVSDEIGVVLTPLQRRIFNIVKAAGSGGITARDVLDMIYANSPDLAPSSRNLVSVVCFHMNKRLEQFSIAVRGTKGRAGYYTLQRLPSGRATKAKVAA